MPTAGRGPSAPCTLGWPAVGSLAVWVAHESRLAQGPSVGRRRWVPTSKGKLRHDTKPPASAYARPQDPSLLSSLPAALEGSSCPVESSQPASFSQSDPCARSPTRSPHSDEAASQVQATRFAHFRRSAGPGVRNASFTLLGYLLILTLGMIPVIRAFLAATPGPPSRRLHAWPRDARCAAHRERAW